MKLRASRNVIVRRLVDGDRAMKQAFTAGATPDPSEVARDEADFDDALSACTGREFRAFMKARRGNGSAG